MNIPPVDSPPLVLTEAPLPLPDPARRIFLCDRCGAAMVELACKITCPNCGNRFDCSDLSIYFD